MPSWEKYPIIAVCVAVVLVLWKSLNEERNGRLSDKDKANELLRAKVVELEGEVDSLHDKLMDGSRDE